MQILRSRPRLVPALVALLVAACQAGGSATDGGPSGSAGSNPGGSAGNAGGPVVSSSPLLPARIRRLSNAELDVSARAVVGSSEPVTADFAPDARQSGYTLNDAQRVDSVLVKQISAAASKLAAQVRLKQAELAPCADPVAQADACAQAFIRSFATRAYRRPLGADEAEKLLALYHVGADGATYADGIELVATGVLQSAGFLYLTETGGAATGAQITLTPYETASALSYLVTGGPPDSALASAAESAALSTPEQRSLQFSRLVGSADGAARGRVVRVVKEWLGVDRLPETAKDSTKYRKFAELKPAMIRETADFVQRLLNKKSGTVAELLGASWTVTADSMLAADYYKGSVGAENEVALPGRRGILNQAAFLSVYAHANETAPVLRGVTVLRRVACMTVASPASLMLTVPPLAPDPKKTMRQRLGDHVINAGCASCHRHIDGFGFAFEQYDGMGAFQEREGEPLVDIDSSTVLATGLDFDGSYANSDAMAVALSTSAAVRECFARNVFRASAGRSDASVQGSEQAFIDYWRTAQKPNDGAVPQSATAFEGSILETLRAFVTSPHFTLRRAQ